MIGLNKIILHYISWIGKREYKKHWKSVLKDAKRLNKQLKKGEKDAR